MSALGRLEPLDLVLHADTQFEQKRTVEMRDWYTQWLRERGVKVEIVTAGDVRDDSKGDGHMPFWTEKGGPLRRQCTGDFKIDPSKRFLRQWIGCPIGRPPHPKAGTFEQWFGFTWDEWHRIFDSDVQYIVNRFPLIERKMTREDCYALLEAEGLPLPIASACIGCPYRSASEWAEMRDNAPGDFALAVQFDEGIRQTPWAIRTGGDADRLYIYKHGGPLAQADLEADARRERQGKQLPLMICGKGGCWT
jgi:hypothetical protein